MTRQQEKNLLFYLEKCHGDICIPIYRNPVSNQLWDVGQHLVPLPEYITCSWNTIEQSKTVCKRNVYGERILLKKILV
jgi:hypothetical protein